MAKFELNLIMVTKESPSLLRGLQQSLLIKFKRRNYMFSTLNLSITLDINHKYAKVSAK